MLPVMNLYEAGIGMFYGVGVLIDYVILWTST